MPITGDATIRNHAAFVWSVADLLRGDYKQSEYGRVILPMVVLRRLDCVLEPTKGEAAGGQQFYNVSQLTMTMLLEDPTNIADKPARGRVGLLRRFSERSNETAGEHFTPREVIRLMVNLAVDRMDRAEGEHLMTNPDKGGQVIRKTAFYVRIGNGTRGTADAAERQKYLAGRWGTAPSRPSTP